MATAGYGDLRLYQRLLLQARPYWPHIAGIFLLSLLSTPLALLAPVPLQVAVDSALGSRPLPGYLEALLPGGGPRSAMTVLLVAAGLLVAVALVGQLQSLAHSLLTAYTGEKLVLAFRAQLFGHAQRLSFAYHDNRGTVDSTYRIQSDAPAIQYIAIHGVIPLVTAAFTLAGMVYCTIRLDWQLALVALAVGPVLLLASRTYRPRLRQASREVKELESSALAVVQEVLGALRVVKAFGQEGREQEPPGPPLQRRDPCPAPPLTAGGQPRPPGRPDDRGGLGRRPGHRHPPRAVRGPHPGRAAPGHGVPVAAVRAAEDAGQEGGQRAVPPGQRRARLRPAGRGPGRRRAARRPAAGARRRRGGLPRRFLRLRRGPARPARRLLRGPAGARVGVVGVTGAGKTTLVNLLTRFYDPTAGQVLLDGVDLRDYRLADLRNQFAIVLQEPVLFSTSIAENIAYARPGAPARRRSWRRHGRPASTTSSPACPKATRPRWASAG